MTQQLHDSSRAEKSSFEIEGQPWVTFSGIMIAIVGVANVIYGLAAIDNSTFFTQNARYIVFDDLNTWGWILTVVGAVQIFAAFGIFARTAWGRWIGIITASGNAIVQLLFISAHPAGALALFAVDLAVIYGLAAWTYREP